MAGLGLFTPTELKGVTRVTASQAYEMSQKGARLVDVRTEREYNTKHARGSILIPYGEKSLKALDFDPKADSFGGIVKARQVAADCFLLQRRRMLEVVQGVEGRRESGFTSVYWLRGGMPEWTTEQSADQSLAESDNPGAVSRRRLPARVRRAGHAHR